MRSYSTDLRQRVVAAPQEGQSYSQVAQRFNVSVPTVGRYRRLAATQKHLNPKPLPGRKPVLNAGEQGEIKQLFQSRTDWTLQTLRQALGEQTGKLISTGCLHKWTHKLGFSYTRNEVYA